MQMAAWAVQTGGCWAGCCQPSRQSTSSCARHARPTRRQPTQIDAAFSPKQDGEWAPAYHGTLYNLTDDAIQVCPPSTKWLVVTNGDNEYGENFMQLVGAACWVLDRRPRLANSSR